MLLYHFTAGEYLRAIAEHGLTVGDVPTDISKFRGRIGVWFTSSETPDGHGLSGRLNKKRFRLSVEFPEGTSQPVKWAEWERINVTLKTREILRAAAEPGGPDAADTWFVFFGHVHPRQISAVTDMASGECISNWSDTWPENASLRGVPFARRAMWQKKMLKGAKKALRSAAA